MIAMKKKDEDFIEGLPKGVREAKDMGDTMREKGDYIKAARFYGRASVMLHFIQRLENCLGD